MERGRCGGARWSTGALEETVIEPACCGQVSREQQGGTSRTRAAELAASCGSTRAILQAAYWSLHWHVCALLSQQGVP